MSPSPRNPVLWRAILVLTLCCAWGFAGEAAQEDAPQSAEAQDAEKETLSAVAGADDGAKTQAKTPRKSKNRLYTAYNIWFEKPDTLFCINYKSGTFIPAGAEVRDATITSGSKGMLKGKTVLRFVTATDGREFLVRIVPKFHPGKTLEDYKEMMFSHKDFEELTQGMTESEIDAIKQGILVDGMSKRAVLACYGPPPEHATFSHDSNQWAYWMNRFRRRDVRFDDQGKTMMTSEGY